MKKKILLIQSTETQGNGTKPHLEDRGYKVILAGSGLTALMLARNMSIDLILLDVALPDMEGMDLCRRFRQRSDTHNIPIILITARGYLPEKSPSSAYRPDDYLAKPYTEIELDKKISVLLAPKEPGAPLPHLPDKQAGSGPLPTPALITISQQAPAQEPEPVYHEAPEAPPEAIANQVPVLQHATALPASADAFPRKAEAARKEGALDAGAASDGDLIGDGPLPLLFFPENGVTVVDPATGLFGRPQFEAMLNKEFKKAVRFKQHLSLMLIDLDGRNRGTTADEALVKAIIVLVQKTIREVDTPAWWSGESFIVMLPNTSSTDALQAAARILDSVALHPFSWPDATQVTMNIGVAGLPNPAIETQQQLVESANATMRRAKELMTPPPFDVRNLRR